MTVSFSKAPGYFTKNTTVAFSAQLNGIDVICEISTEALEDHFNASSGRGPDLVVAFEKNRSSIEAVARVKLLQGTPTERCLLISADF